MWARIQEGLSYRTLLSFSCYRTHFWVGLTYSHVLCLRLLDFFLYPHDSSSSKDFPWEWGSASLSISWQSLYTLQLNSKKTQETEAPKLFRFLPCFLLRAFPLTLSPCLFSPVSISAPRRSRSDADYADRFKSIDKMHIFLEMH